MKKTVSILVTLTVLLGLISGGSILTPEPAMAQFSPTWTHNGPYGGTVRAIAAYKPPAAFGGLASATIAFAGTEAGGVFVNRLSGGLPAEPQWQPINNGLTNLNVRALAISPCGFFKGTPPAGCPTVPDRTVFAGTWGGGIFRSVDGGEHWDSVGRGLTSLNINAITLSPNYQLDRIVIVGTDNGVFMSNDAGLNFHTVNGVSPNNLPYLDVRALATLLLEDKLYIIAGTWGGGVLRGTLDGSMNVIWDDQLNGQMNTPDSFLGNLYVHSIAMSPGFDPRPPTSNTNFFVGTEDGIYKYSRNGWPGVGGWQPVSSGLAGASLRVRTIALSNSIDTDNTLSIGTDAGVYRSPNLGSSWQFYSTGLDQDLVVWSLEYLNNLPTSILAGVQSKGLFVASNAGSTPNVWIAQNMTTLAVYDVAVSPNYASDGTVIAGTSVGLFRSTDSGGSWTAANSGLACNWIYAVAFSPAYASDRTIFIGTNCGVYKSSDGGGTWSSKNSGITGAPVRALAISSNYASNGTVFAGTESGGIYRTDNKGDSWTQKNTGLGSLSIWALAISPNYANDRVAFAGTIDGGVYKTTTGGDAWSQHSNGISNRTISSLAISPVYNETGADGTHAKTIYAGTGNSLAREAYGQLVFGVRGAGVFVSTNGGVNWAPAGAPPRQDEAGQFYSVQDVLISPNFASDETIFAAVQETPRGWFGPTDAYPPPVGAVFQSANGGDSWAIMPNQGLGGQLYVGTANSNQIIIQHNPPLYSLAYGSLFAGGKGGVWKGDPVSLGVGPQPTPVPTGVYPTPIPGSDVDARIQVVWPHDDYGNYAAVNRATKANVKAYLFEFGTTTSVSYNFNRNVWIWQAVNNEPATPVKLADKEWETSRAGCSPVLNFPAWKANDINVQEARDPMYKYFFMVRADGMDTRTNIWSHGYDARTYQPTAPCPATVLNSVPTDVDARIVIVWPHDQWGQARSVTDATLANVRVYLFQHGTFNAVPSSWNPTVRIWKSLNNGTAQKEPVTGVKFMDNLCGKQFPAWEFSDIDVSQARNATNKYYFHITIDELPDNTYSSIWAHGADARTYYPEAECPTAVSP